MAKNIGNINIKYYLLLAGTGIMMLFSSIQISTLHILPYPPFGLITLSIMPISSYLVIVGLYYSARTVSYDKKILSELGRQIKSESQSFLKAIGSAEWDKHLEMTVKGVLKQVKDDEAADSSLEELDIRNYVLEVIEQLKKHENRLP